MQHKTDGTGPHHQNGWPFSEDPHREFIRAGRDAVLTLAGSAANEYVNRNLGRGEEAHVKAELAYTRLALHLGQFEPPNDPAARETSKQLERAQGALDDLWMLHRRAA